MNHPSHMAWRKFRVHLPAMLGLGYAVLCVLIALLGYLIVPDNTRYANFQILELAKLPPGSGATVLLIPKSGREDPHALGWISGREQRHIPVPLAEVADVSLSETHVRFTHYSGVRDSLELNLFDATPFRNEQEFFNHHTRSLSFLLGTDGYGRDLLSRIVLGTRVSLSIGLMAVLISLGIGVVLGTLAGYYGGAVDKAIMWVISVMWAIPTLLLALAISFVLGRGLWQLMIAIGVSMWVESARIVRGQILSVREKLFAEAGRALGFSHIRLMFRHILPNVVSPIIVVAVANFGAAVLIESGLSFLGIGVEVPLPTWGRMIYEGYTNIVFENGKWLAIFPGMALILLIMAINLIGIGLRDALDVKLN
ncbi:MAG: ABC transporter permease [Bacteroidota bacterium]